MATSSPSIKTILSVFRFTLLLLILLGVVYYAPRPISSLFKPADKQIVFDDSRSYGVFLENFSANLYHVRNSKKSIFLNTVNLPGDLLHFPASERPSLFIALVLPHAIKCNENILRQRKKLIQYIIDETNGNAISENRKAWLRQISRRFNKEESRPEKLLENVDIIPVSLTIAQAITESGWGTSRFALLGNALYGQHFSEKSKGRFITSLSGEVKVAAFDSIFDSTTSYIHNLNTSKAYHKLRTIRMTLRQQGKLPDGYSLAEGLLNYSEIGEEYISDIRYLIRQYQLEQLEQTQLLQQSGSMLIRFKREAEAAPTLIHTAPKTITTGDNFI